MFLDATKHNENVTDLANCKVGESVSVSGMIHNVRVTKWGGFIVLRKSRGLLQAVVSNETSKFFDETGAEIAMNDLCREMAITLTGTVNEAKIKDPAAFYNTIEIAVAEVRVLSRPTTPEVVDMNALKFGDEETLLRYKFDNRQVTLRNPRDMAMSSRWIISASRCTSRNRRSSTNRLAWAFTSVSSRSLRPIAQRNMRLVVTSTSISPSMWRWASSKVRKMS